MFNSIKTSFENKVIISELTRKLNLGSENIIARLALAFSLSQNRKMNLKEIKDSKGKEYSKNVLFGQNLSIYIALICNNYKIYKTDKDIPKYIKMHIDDGLSLLHLEFSRTKNLSGFDFLLNLIEQNLPNIA